MTLTLLRTTGGGTGVSNNYLTPLIAGDFVKPECPFTQALTSLDPFVLSERTYPEVNNAMLVKGSVVGSRVVYTTPKGRHKYIFEARESNKVLMVTGPDRPTYRYESNPDVTLAPQSALSPDDVAIGFQWEEIDIRTGIIYYLICVGPGVIETEGTARVEAGSDYVAIYQAAYDAKLAE